VEPALHPHTLGHATRETLPGASPAVIPLTKRLAPLAEGTPSYEQCGKLINRVIAA
jgi:hypothetical protein